MSKRTLEKDAIPLSSEEATIIIKKLFNEAISIFEKYKINVDWNSWKE